MQKGTTWVTVISRNDVVGIIPIKSWVDKDYPELAITPDIGVSYSDNPKSLPVYWFNSTETQRDMAIRERQYNITHIRSGLSVFGRSMRLSVARNAFHEIHDLVDWGRSKSDIEADKDAMRTVSDFRRERALELQ